MPGWPSLMQHGCKPSSNPMKRWEPLAPFNSSCRSRRWRQRKPKDGKSTRQSFTKCIVFFPLAPKVEVIDLVAQLKLPVVVVGRSRLGGINHALLTVEALRRRKIPIAALVLNQTEPGRSKLDRLQERTTVEILRKKAGVPVLGPLPYRSELSRQFRRSVTRLAQSAAIRKLVKVVRRALK